MSLPEEIAVIKVMILISIYILSSWLRPTFFAFLESITAYEKETDQAFG
jgi:hypothetical protein